MTSILWFNNGLKNTCNTKLILQRRNLFLGIALQQQKTDLDYYSILKISPNASQKQIKAAYYKQSLILHPDRNIGSSESNETAARNFAQLNEAYRILGNNQSRKDYDRRLKVHHQYANQKSTFSEDVIQRHGRNANVKQASRQFDTWTQSHYQNSLQRREQRQKKEHLRQNISREESQQQSLRLLTIASIAAVATGLVINNRRLKNDDRVK